jgi:hypothetical protein
VAGSVSVLVTKGGAGTGAGQKGLEHGDGAWSVLIPVLMWNTGPGGSGRGRSVLGAGASEGRGMRTMHASRLRQPSVQSWPVRPFQACHTILCSREAGDKAHATERGRRKERKGARPTERSTGTAGDEGHEHRSALADTDYRTTPMICPELALHPLYPE